ncbi:coiled-coil domain-containing protein 200 [Dipodomys merriami]|uniref:coiled-coil domain-containing protein 200 n=1 Tax=Dipodomys merriami TaxID=94247 RepID=UPI003855F822
MASAYHWEARRRQMALDQRRWRLIQQQQEQQEQEPERYPQKEQDPENKSQPTYPKETQSPLLQLQQPATQPKPPLQKPLPQPEVQPSLPQPSQRELDLSVQCAFEYNLQKDTQRQGPQLGSDGTDQTGQPSYCTNRVQDGPNILPGPGPMKLCQPTSNKDKRLTSTNYIQQW